MLQVAGCDPLSIGITLLGYLLPVLIQSLTSGLVV